MILYSGYTRPQKENKTGVYIRIVDFVTKCVSMSYL